MQPLVKIHGQDLVSLIDAALEANYTDVRKLGSRLATQIGLTDLETAQQIKSSLKKRGVPLRTSGYTESLPTDPKSRAPLVEEQPWPVTPIFLEDNLKSTFDAFISDIKNHDKLALHGLLGKSNLLMSGPPGTGKTLVAGHIASQLGLPLYVVRLDSLVSSLLGDTAKNIRGVFDYVPQMGGVLFLDEFDAIAKVRDDRHELGELKRVVNTLIQAIDALDDRAILIAATNHSELLDRAIWRRFPYKMHFSLPSFELKKHLWNHFLFKDNGADSDLNILTKLSKSLSGADIESISLAARRDAVIKDADLDIAHAALSILELEMQTSSSTSLRYDTQSKKHAAKSLHSNYELSQADIGKVLNLSRQTISSYLKES
ncbi:AAA family ATPase [Pseudomonas protegens]|uniref:AAA family ATPase n=1 Tax=Pseudomonas protegens TaxID=380021 RepID=UPI0009BAED6D|nr:ATP-binding protein [Pseudomonas protegens]